MTTRRLIAVAAVLLLTFVQQAQAGAQATPTPFPTPTPYSTPTAPAVISDTLTITSAADVASRRAALRAHIWPGGYPEARAFDDYLGVDDPTLLAAIGTTSLAHVHRYRIRQSYGIDVDMWLYQARYPSGVSLLYHAGHDFTPLSDATLALLPRLLAAGVDVVVVGMILVPYNPDPTYQGYLIQVHTDPAAMPRVNGNHPLAFFLEPAIAGINALKAVYPSRPVNMVGLSGGGWTVSLMAALDMRIVKSFNVAGSQPFDVFLDGSVSPAWGVIWRDWEQGSPHQGHTDTYQIAGYRDLYVMGASGAGRSQLQILNEYDPCCFWANGADLSYGRAVQKRVLEIGDGDYRLWVDRGQSTHTVSLAATNQILNELGRPPVAP